MKYIDKIETVTDWQPFVIKMQPSFKGITDYDISMQNVRSGIHLFIHGFIYQLIYPTTYFERFS